MESNLDTFRVWCPYEQYYSNLPKVEGDIPSVQQGSVMPAMRSNNSNTQMPAAPVHGGLYNATPSNNPWNSIPVTATMTNYIQNNLRSANPPPGATEQYIQSNRLGNSYGPQPGVYRFNPSGPMKGKYNMLSTHQCEQRSFNPDGTPVQKQ
jgi:hypothetical protein